jgi:hypothetical protein
MSLLLRRWRCIDDELLLRTEEDYRVHTALFPTHRIVADESNEGEQGNELSVRFEPLSELPLFQIEDPSETE